ncbi:glutamine amidotransferase-like protein-like protein [Pyrenophora tritici-repentis]|uniref:Glutamine amidotransferase protein n=2 Tax=Pyrenophora tritici-repentis TaxID=45151 RepID=A0A317B9P1_9PLEO|nr:uncharacterized protein PTRG_09777 [Pyrenophora tritici-repentis Pt-1C-BFP]KAA8621853.1 glutamine amidotransferase-like protein-like protein [Pyrenophora tritici-repentis]EDU42828.1 conserved hypothetical protein [Pyrenophora tritici-repentis Pt-1C-BFP]KAF7441507.1 glutamine amidotransferase protein [Pyrenophora tritici-repentis]KAF7451072.1 glutamine amidotransferase protein [Pyrenophora tritici-repentis]KAI0578253.1 glutamine amidotransferase-like protein-like protein [Pyrenophora tritici
MPQIIRICMLNADTPVPAVIAKNNTTPTYGRIFHHLLSTAATNLSKTPDSHHGATTITSIDFNVVKNEYPPSLSAFDAIVISGSANSAYDNIPWIHKLARWLKDVYDKEPRVRIFGSCFGHQIVTLALLGRYGVRVEKDPQGWELGVGEITLQANFLRRFCGGDGDVDGEGKKLRLQFVHHDHVVIPDSSTLPPSWMVVGSTQHCAVQGLYEAGRVFTLQGHFEFDRFVNAETVKFFFPEWQPKVLEGALEAIDQDDDAVRAAEMVVRFFLEGGGGIGRGRGVGRFVGEVRE